MGPNGPATIIRGNLPRALSKEESELKDRLAFSFVWEGSFGEDLIRGGLVAPDNECEFRLNDACITGNPLGKPRLTQVGPFHHFDPPIPGPAPIGATFDERDLAKQYMEAALEQFLAQNGGSTRQDMSM